MNPEALKNLLNEPQYEAATTQDGPLLVLAGAGSGKTRVLTYRIAYLVGACNVKPWQILAITFTNKAAREMRERTERLIGEDVTGMWLHTFHAACGKILRSHAERIGFTKKFVVYDDTESLSLIKDVLKRLDLDEKRFPPRAVRSRIAECKDRLQTPEQYAATVSETNYDDRKYARCYELYQQLLKMQDAMDFDDMILKTLELFQSCPDVLELYQQKFRYILVDEYQDTNRAQYLFISMLARKHRNLCVVGDDDQSIYSFRGADITNILNFTKEYPDAKVVKLEQNYRSTQNILNVANDIIHKSNRRNAKKLWTAGEAGDPVYHYAAYDQNDEARFISRAIQKMVQERTSRYADFAVLYRANALSNSLENTLMRDGIPYRVYGGMKFYDRKEIKDLVCYLRVFNNPLDELSLKRIINVPKRGIGDTSVGYASEIAADLRVPLFQVLLAADQYPKLSRAADKMKSFAESFLNLMMEKDQLSITDFVERVLNESGMVREYEKEHTMEAEAKIENLKEFLSVTKSFEEEQKQLGNEAPAFSEFLENITLSTDTEAASDDPNESRVTLMTIHSAKGLEFPVVFVVGMEEGIFPSARAMETEGALDEERRLCYVAVTRAKEKLYLTNAASRMLYGKTTPNLPSRFLSEIPPEALEECGRSERRHTEYDGAYNFSRTGGSDAFWSEIRAEQEREKRYARESAPRQKVWHFETDPESASDAYITDCEVGVRVRHKKFGDGTVSKILGDGKNKTLEIVFDNCGMKRLILLYAKLIRI